MLPTPQAPEGLQQQLHFLQGRACERGMKPLQFHDMHQMLPLLNNH